VKAGVLLLEVAVRGLDEGTHSLVFFLEGVELLRATRFDDAPTECVAHTLLTGKEAHSSKTGAALATSSDCAAGEETVRRVGVRIRVAPGEASFGVHVQDARTRRAEAQAECRVTFDGPKHRSPGPRTARRTHVSRKNSPSAPAQVDYT